MVIIAMWMKKIERLIGTLMGRVHLLPGTTTSNVADRGDYDSAKSAGMNLDVGRAQA